MQEKRNIYDQISAADELRQQQQDTVTRLKTELQARHPLALATAQREASRPAPHRTTPPRTAPQRATTAPLLPLPCAQVFSVDEIERKIKVRATPSAALATGCRASRRPGRLAAPP